MSAFRHARGVGLAILLATVLAAFAGHAEEEVQLPWQPGPMNAAIGNGLAHIELSESYVFLDADGTRKFMELTQNPVSGSEMATVMPTDPEQDWFLVFEYEASGYVADDEKDSLDAEAMITSIREGTEAANEERRSRGWDTMNIVGWQEEPFYDPQTNNLTWSIMGESAGIQNVNRTIKLLGRRGVMTATLVSSPEILPLAAPLTDTLLAGYDYVAGNTYAEYVPGTDKLAAYGLTALVVGGGAAALVKSGILARFWKPLVVALVAMGAGIKRIFTTGRSAKHGMDDPIA
jgi:uncharacterized membrane-anchored protein